MSVNCPVSITVVLVTQSTWHVSFITCYDTENTSEYIQYKIYQLIVQYRSRWWHATADVSGSNVHTSKTLVNMSGRNHSKNPGTIYNLSPDYRLHQRNEASKLQSSRPKLHSKCINTSRSSQSQSNPVKNPATKHTSHVYTNITSTLNIHK